MKTLIYAIRKEPQEIKPAVANWILNYSPGTSCEVRRQWRCKATVSRASCDLPVKPADKFSRFWTLCHICSVFMSWLQASGLNAKTCSQETGLQFVVLFLMGAQHTSHMLIILLVFFSRKLTTFSVIIVNAATIKTCITYILSCFLYVIRMPQAFSWTFLY